LITVVNWEKHNPRKDVKHPRWFGMSHGIFEDPVILNLNSDEFKFWVYILCLASKGDPRGTALLIHHVAARYLTIDEKVVHQAIQKLQRFNVVRQRTLRGRYVHVRKKTVDVPLQNRTEQNKTEQNKEYSHQASPADLSPLVEIWNTNTNSVLPKVRGCSGLRRRQAAARWREKPDKLYWLSVIDAILRTPFLVGKNDRGWRANFDFFVRPESHHKILEGQYGVPSQSSEDRAEIEKQRQRSVDEFIEIQETLANAR